MPGAAPILVAATALPDGLTLQTTWSLPITLGGGGSPTVTIAARKITDAATGSGTVDGATASWTISDPANRVRFGDVATASFPASAVLNGATGNQAITDAPVTNNAPAVQSGRVCRVNRVNRVSRV